MDLAIVQSAWWIPLYNLAGAVLAMPWSPGIIRKTGPRPAGYLNLVATLFALTHCLLLLREVWGEGPVAMSFTWLEVPGLTLTLPLEISAVTVTAAAVVAGLGLLAQLYAIAYMEMDWGWARLFSLLGLFQAGMSALVLCNSLFFSYFILEILTLGTYLLVGFWFNQPLVVTGARDAFLTKRVGDLFMLMGVLALWPLAGTWDFSQLARWAATTPPDPTIATLLGLALIAGPIGKCAQFPLHLWLDEAMEGPLPSTILRNSVVVATGAWVLVKMYPLVALSPVTVAVLIAIGSITALGGSLVALAQIDVKRVLSYLVSAYLGLVLIAVAVGQLSTALLLLLAHALAMALLVMSVGSVVWNNISQDLSQLGGLWSRRPITALCYLTGCFGLVAALPLGGLWAQLEMVEGLWNAQPLLAVLVVVVNALAGFALGRVFGLIFLGKPAQMTVRSPEAPWPIVVPMTVLAGLVVHFPIVLATIGLLPGTAANPLAVPALVALVVPGLAGVVLGARLRPVELPIRPVQDWLANDFYTAVAYKNTIVFVIGLISQFVSLFDRYVVDGLVNLVGQLSFLGGEGIKYSTTGQTQFYLLTIILGVVLLGMLMI
ncbi:NAD(P)H-quinone oxidoreductase subunit F [Gloeobacter morelensis]|uniref:NAD(P)H-quinone oxidoreductase subunit F n=1 Tax=Gloeobacter morelensis MG652769 TaxID=2781736 RepID=A0ABY3PG64_9CYAN|nr:NAD(P)H-quinone oxidoreductase subunit F [Gloeobacter morelensis]UFP92646.1 NAD(P)H-quinone oxidoreductase subunit F [Gloeobacter morelensis MG652769]